MITRCLIGVDVEKLLETAKADISDVLDKIDVINTTKIAFVNENVFLNGWSCVVTYLCFHKHIWSYILWTKNSL